MCGLILAPSVYPEDRVVGALVRMGYRGPDFQSIITAGSWHIGHARLAIQDLSEKGNQPFIEGNRAFAFVGELFNHKHGERELLTLLLDNIDLFHDVDGFWSVVEAQGRQARAITDHLGIKPLYWWPKHRIVCSEITPMFALEAAPALDEVYLSNCIKFGYDYSGRTAWEGVYQIAPGTVVNFDGEGITLGAYWDWRRVALARSLRDELDKAISNRLISDRPIALLFSGGLDSSIVYYSLKAQGQQVQTFTVENGESEYLPPEVQVLDMKSVCIRQALAAMQAPIDLGSLLPQVQLAEAVKAQGFKVCLTGDGADELFGGYRRAKDYDSQHSDVFCELPYYHLPRLDRIMMRSTIELRSPFLAPKVVAHALRLPWEQRTEKQALKAAYADLLPETILQRPKHPLKSQAVLTGGLEYRNALVKEMRNAQKYL